MPEPEPFKSCTLCPATWADAEDFIRDRDLRVEGYLAAFSDPADGLILVTHCQQGCGTTLAIRAGALRHLYHGPQHTEHHAGQEDCRGLCLNREALQACDVDCDMAWVREIIRALCEHRVPGSE